MSRTLPREITGEQALTLFLAAAVAPSLKADELDASMPQIRHLAGLMISRRVAAPADVDPTTTRFVGIPSTVDPRRLDPPTVRLEPARPPTSKPAPAAAVTPKPTGPRHAAAERRPSIPLAPIRARKEPTMIRQIGRALLGVALLALLVIGAAAVTATNPLPPSPTSSTPPAAITVQPATPVDEQAPDGSLAGDGTYVVGSDVKPGTYRSTGPSRDGGVCYWARLKDTDGDFDSILANDAGKGSALVTVKSTDAAFTSRGCATWTRSK